MYSKLDVRKLLLIIAILFCWNAGAQVPNFYRSAGKNKIYSFADVYWKDSQNIYPLTTLQYGITEHFAAGLKFSDNNIGIVTRCGFPINEHLGIGLEVTPMFNNHNYMKLDRIKAFLVANGTIVNQWMYCVNTWFERANNYTTVIQYAYIGYNIPLSDNTSLLPMAGLYTNLDKKTNFDPVLGIMISYKDWCLSIWTSEFASKKPLIELCLDVRL